MKKIYTVAITLCLLLNNIFGQEKKFEIEYSKPQKGNFADMLISDNGELAVVYYDKRTDPPQVQLYDSNFNPVKHLTLPRGTQKGDWVLPHNFINGEIIAYGGSVDGIDIKTLNVYRFSASSGAPTKKPYDLFSQVDGMKKNYPYMNNFSVRYAKCDHRTGYFFQDTKNFYVWMFDDKMELVWNKKIPYGREIPATSKIWDIMIAPEGEVYFSYKYSKENFPPTMAFVRMGHFSADGKFSYVEIPLSGSIHFSVTLGINNAPIVSYTLSSKKNDNYDSYGFILYDNDLNVIKKGQIAIDDKIAALAAKGPKHPGITGLTPYGLMQRSDSSFVFRTHKEEVMSYGYGSGHAPQLGASVFFFVSKDLKQTGYIVMDNLGKEGVLWTSSYINIRQEGDTIYLFYKDTRKLDHGNVRSLARILYPNNKISDEIEVVPVGREVPSFGSSSRWRGCDMLHYRGEYVGFVDVREGYKLFKMKLPK